MFGVMFRNDLNPTCTAEVSHDKIVGHSPADLRDHLPDVLEIPTPAQRTLREELFDESRSNVVTHLFEMFIDLGVVLIVLDELHDQCAVGHCE